MLRRPYATGVHPELCSLFTLVKREAGDAMRQAKKHLRHPIEEHVRIAEMLGVVVGGRREGVD